MIVVFHILLFFSCVINSVRMLSDDRYAVAYRRIGNNEICVTGALMYKNGLGNSDSEVVSVNPFIVTDHPLTNSEYREVLKWAFDNKKRDVEFLMKLIPSYDDVGFLKEYGITGDRMIDYFLSDEYNDYPVVGLSCEQMEEFINIVSEMRKLPYRIMKKDEFNFLMYGVINIDVNDDVEIVQNKSFDDGKIRKIEMGNIIRREKEKERISKLPKRRKKKSKYGVDDEYVMRNTDEVYDFGNFYNLRSHKVKFNYTGPMFTSVYKYEPNEYSVYDLIGNTYEVTKDEDKICLCGGSCFEFYEDIDINKSFEIEKNNARMDASFRLVRDMDSETLVKISGRENFCNLKKINTNKKRNVVRKDKKGKK